MPTLRTLFSAAASALTLLVAQPGLAQDAYPSKPIKIIVALPAGGSVDMVARLIGQQLSVDLGQPVLIDRFLEDAIEVDVDAIADGEDVLVAGIMEHIEQAGVHSGKSACPPSPRGRPTATR